MRRSSLLPAGLVLAAVLAVLDLAGLAGLFVQAGPPAALVVAGALLGVATIVSLPAAWRGRRQATAIVIGTRVVSGLLSIPAFFAPEAPVWAKVVAALAIAITAATAVLVWIGSRHQAGVA